MTRWPGLIVAAGLVLLSVSSATLFSACSPSSGVMTRNNSELTADTPKAENHSISPQYDDTPPGGSLAFDNPERAWPLTLLQERAKSPKPLTGAVGALAISSKAGLALALLKDGSVYLQDAPGKRMSLLNIYERPAEDAGGPVGVVWGPHLDRAAFMSGRGLEIVRVADGKVAERWAGESPSRALSAAFTPDGTSLLIGAADGRVYRWSYALQETLLEQLTDGEPRRWERYVVHSTSVSAIAMHPRGRFFVSGDLRGKLFAVLLFDADAFGGVYDESAVPGGAFTDKVIRVGSGGDFPGVTDIVMSTDGQRFVVAREDGSLELWQVRGFKKLTQVQAHRGAVKALALDAAGNRIVSYGRDGFLRRYSLRPCLPGDVARGACELELVNERAEGEVQALSIQGNSIARASSAGIVMEPYA